MARPTGGVVAPRLVVRNQETTYRSRVLRKGGAPALATGCVLELLVAGGPCGYRLVSSRGLTLVKRGVRLSGWVR